MAELNLKQIVAERLGENYQLHERYINPTLVKVFRTIGFDKVYARAKGQYLWDKEGNRYLDMLSGFGVFSIGRNHPAVAQVIRDVLDLDLPNMVQMDCAFLAGLLAEKLIQITPPHLEAVFFCNSGTEAVEASLKFARAATGRHKFAYLHHAWHGLTLGSLSIMGNDEFREDFGEMLPGERVPYGDLEALERVLAKRDVACLAVECIQGKGVRLPPDDYLPAAQALCRKYGTLFFCDEVQTGFGRTGKMFAFEHWNLEPDIISTSKALSGGYVPVGAMITRRWIYQKVFHRMDRCWVHSSSFGRNNLGMAVGLATLHILEQEKLVERSAQQGAKLLAAINALKAKHEVLLEARGKGCMIGIEFCEPRSLKLKMAWKMVHAAHDGLFAQMVVMPLLQKHRILTQVSGNHGDIIRILPPFVISDEDIQYFVQALDDVLSDCHKLPGPMWDLGKNLIAAALRSKNEQPATPGCGELTTAALAVLPRGMARADRAMSFLYEIVSGIPGLAPLLPVISLLATAFTLWMIVDCIRSGNDWYWILLMLFFPFIGALIYYFVCKWGRTGFQTRWAARRHRRDRIRELETKIHHLDKADHYAELGDIHREDGNWVEAARNYRAALERDPDLHEAHARLGYVLLAQGKPDEAWPLLQAVLQKDPALDYGELLWKAAQCQAARGRLAEAGELYRQLLSRHTYSQARLEYAQVLEKLGELRASTDVLKQLIAEARHVPKFQRQQEARWVKQAESILRSRGVAS